VPEGAEEEEKEGAEPGGGVCIGGRVPPGDSGGIVEPGASGGIVEPGASGGRVEPGGKVAPGEREEEAGAKVLLGAEGAEGAEDAAAGEIVELSVQV